MTTHSNPLVADYLRRLERASASLPRPRRLELVAEIREHVDDALLEAGAADEVAVRNVLDRLGPPEEIAAAAAPSVEPAGHTGRLEIAALIALALPFVGWLVGIPLVLWSRAWATREKSIAALLGVAPLHVAFLLMAVGAESGSEEGVTVGAPETAPTGDSGLGPLEVALLSTAVLGGPIGAAYLAIRLRRAAGSRPIEV